VNANQYAEDSDGIDRHFGVNWLGNYYALNQLYPLILKTSKMPDTPAPRIIAESSTMHKTAPGKNHFGSISEINNPDLSPIELYGRTKLCFILGMSYLAEKIIKPHSQNVYALSVHPGAVSGALESNLIFR
jgi:NAD(P)-dependent dehydrogenase (short-subunit alcohol dehydrogenase family)